MTWIQTYTGKKFDLVRPDSDLVDIDDIAHALSNVCRFGGHVRSFYSVAQHSIHVAEHLTDMDPQIQMQGLMHDAAEAYVGDMVRPLKRTMPMFIGVEERIWFAICERFNFTDEMHSRVKTADNMMLFTEARDLMTVNRLNEWATDLEPSTVVKKVIPWGPGVARARFLAAFYALEEEIG